MNRRRRFRILLVLLGFATAGIVWLAISGVWFDTLVGNRQLRLLVVIGDLVFLFISILAMLWFRRLSPSADVEKKVHERTRELEQVNLNLRDREAKYEVLLSRLEIQTRTLQLLEQVRTALAREVNVQELIKTTVEAVSATFGYTQVSLYLLDGDMLVLQHQIGYDTVLDRIPLTRGVLARTVRSGQPVLIKDVRKDPDFLGAIEGIVSEICVPLIDDGRVVGGFNVESTNGVILDEDDLSLVLALSEHINIAISRARLYSSIRESEEQLRQTFELAPIGILLSNPTGKIVRVNRAICQLLGYDDHELTELTVRGVTHPDDAQHNLITSTKLIQLKLSHIRQERRFLKKNGDVIHAIVQVSALHDQANAIRNFIWQIVDITDLKTAENALLELNAELGRRVAERTSDLVQANQRLKELDRLKTKFIADISHELRTPLTSLMLRVSLLERSSGANLNEHFHVLKRQMSRLSTLLNGILDFSRIEEIDPAHVTLHPLNLNDVVQDSREIFSTRAEMSQLELIYELTPVSLPISGDPEHLIRVVNNLIDNALKYTQAGSITVRTYSEQMTDTKWQAVVEVKDTGRGIPLEEQANIFERFYRGREVGSSTIPGTGLGLSIVKEILALHRGEIDLESEPGKGSTFRIRLPLLSIGRTQASGN